MKDSNNLRNPKNIKQDLESRRNESYVLSTPGELNQTRIIIMHIHICNRKPTKI